MYGQGYAPAVGGDEEDYLYQQQGNGSASDSDNIDSDVEDKILSHFYYQSNEQATISATAPAQPSRTSTPVPLRRKLVPERLTEPTESNNNNNNDAANNEDQSSKYKIESKRRKTGNNWEISELAARTASELNANSALSSDDENHSSRADGAVSVTVIPAFRPATNSDDACSSTDEDGQLHENGTPSSTRNELLKPIVSAENTVSYNASDDDAVNDYLDSVATSGLTTPPGAVTPSTQLNGTGSQQAIGRQLVQIDTLLSPSSNTNPAGAILHNIPVKRSLDPEDNEYDYLDEAEIQGRNRYFMEEKEMVCRKCHKSGHVAKECTTVTCMVCGHEGHETKNCKLTGNVCHRCNMRGHIAVDCPMRSGKRRERQRTTGCERCNSRSHHTDECSTIWRSYVYSDPPPLKYNEVTPWCYNCACSGHFGDDCLAPRGRGASAFLDNTAFNFGNCPGRCVGEPNLHQLDRNRYTSGSSTPHRGRHGVPANREERRRESGYGRRDARGHRPDYRKKRSSAGGSRAKPIHISTKKKSASSSRGSGSVSVHQHR
ncbi:hypothetical protein BX070DRAFT_234121 [Coemansia spiralis]|nr:hypothetical protein BX070DRAFT_234121 [Coemansia spiralis]